MNSLDVYHRDRKVGQLEVVDHIRLPFEPQHQLIFDMSLRSRNFLYKPSRGDFVLEERDGKLVVVAANPRLGTGDVGLLVGFTSELDAYKPDTEMDNIVKEMAPGMGEQAMDMFSIMTGVVTGGGRDNAEPSRDYSDGFGFYETDRNGRKTYNTFR